MYRDERLGLWVASSAAAVMDVLGSELCHVRPPTEPVPRALIGTPAGEIFRQLVRMNDGENHCPFKNAIVATIDGIDMTALSRVASERAAALAETLSPHRSPAGLTRFLFAVPVETIATLLGVPSTELASTVEHVAAFVSAISPIAEAAEIVRGNEAAAHPDLAVPGIARGATTGGQRSRTEQACEGSSGRWAWRGEPHCCEWHRLHVADL